MRILSITAGAAGMYCGSCLRDNSLAAELLARGHDVTLLPVYTPTTSDEPNVSRPEVLFGGISVYLQQYSALFRKLPRAFDRVFDSPRVIKAVAGRSISTDPRLLGDLTISMLEGDGGILRREFDKLLEWLAAEPVPDVINLPNSLLIGLAEPLSRALGRPVTCTLQGEELFLEQLVEPHKHRAIQLIRDRIHHVERFIAVSEHCAAFMTAYLRIPAGRVSVVPLGITLNGYDEPRDAEPDVFRVGYFARVAPEKGLHVLADAYVRLRARMPDARLRLEVAGYLAREHRPYLATIERTLREAGLGEEFRYRGAVDRDGKLRFLRGIDVLSVPATYDEPKGVFLLEAMAARVPVVQPRRGAFTEVIEKTGGGLLVEPDDVDSLAAGLETLGRDRAMAERLGRSGAAGVKTHYSISRSADRLLEIYGEVAATHRDRRAAHGTTAPRGGGDERSGPPDRGFRARSQ